MKRLLTLFLVGVLSVPSVYAYSFDTKWPDQPCIMPSRGIAIDSSGNIYIAETESHRVTKWTMSGPTILTIDHWGSRGSGAGEFRYPYGIAVGEQGGTEYVFVMDSGNHRVQKFTPAGEFLWEFGKHGTGEGEFECPVSVAVGEDGSVYVSDWGNNRVQKFDPDGKVVCCFPEIPMRKLDLACPSAVAVDPHGSIYVSDSLNHRVLRLEPAGARL